jgi:hypothetical protein
MMTTRNRFIQDGLQQVGEMGVIPGKVFRDHALIAQLQSDAVDSSRAPFCFPNGNVDEVHDAHDGDTSIGYRARRAGDLDGTLDEEGIVSVSGLCWRDYKSQDEMESAFYWQGIVTTPDESQKQMDANQSDDTGQGHGTVVVGTKSITASGPEPFYPGDPIVWELPEAPFHPCSGGSDTLDRINRFASRGSNPLQHKVVYRPFDPSDLGVHFAGAYALFDVPQANGGISDIPLSDALPQQSAALGSRKHSAIQEEALSYKFGIWGIGLTIVQCLLRKGIIVLSNEMTPVDGVSRMTIMPPAEVRESMNKITQAVDLFGTDVSGITNEGLRDVMLRNISPMDTARSDAISKFENELGIGVFKASISTPDKTDELGQYAALRVHLCDVWTQGLTSTWARKTSKIVGRAMNAAAPNDTLDVLWGHFRFG